MIPAGAAVVKDEGLGSDWDAAPFFLKRARFWQVFYAFPWHSVISNAQN
jgi:hypothetical protein